MEQGLPRAVVKVLVADRSSVDVGKHPFGYPLLGSANPVLFECNKSELRQLYGSVPGFCLGRVNLAIVDASIDPERSCIEVYILPLQSQELALSHPRSDCEHVQGL